MFIDNLLTQEALTELRAFCLESTIWKRDYQNGYIGTFLANGFACPLLLQIAEELRSRFPRIFQQHQLVQAWAFKHDSALRGLNMHADAAAVNVNFWITPNDANRNSDNGGLVVWDKEAPDDWDFAEFNNDKNRHKIQEFLEENQAQPITISAPPKPCGHFQFQPLPRNRRSSTFRTTMNVDASTSPSSTATAKRFDPPRSLSGLGRIGCKSV